jgi:hypothetical protein
MRFMALSSGGWADLRRDLRDSFGDFRGGGSLLGDFPECARVAGG